jgi:hypothetical protein
MLASTQSEIHGRSAAHLFDTTGNRMAAELLTNRDRVGI